MRVTHGRFTRMAFCLMAAALLPAVAPGAEPLELADVVAKDATMRKVAGGCAFTEGPAWSPAGFLVFSDIPNNRILKALDEGNSQEFLKPSGKSNGLIYDAKGRLYLCRSDPPQIARLDSPDNKELTLLAAEFDGQPFNSPNDLALDQHGGLYFTDPSYGGKKSQPVQGVYYIAEDGKVTRVIADLDRPNGILVSADGQTLYVAEPDHRELYAYGILAPGQLSAGRRIYVGDEQLDGGGPDGMTLDEQGNVYATYGSVVVLTPTGDLIGRIAVPERPANVEFGGPDGKTLYITARTSLYSIPTQVAGIAAPPAGKLEGTVLAQARSVKAATLAVKDEPDVPQQADKKEAKKEDAEKPAAEKPAAEKTRVAEVRSLKLVVPESWKTKPASGFRATQFEVPATGKDEVAGDYVVFYFPNGGGDAKANTLRWIKQFDAKGRKVKVSTGESKVGKYTLVDVSGDYNKSVGPPIQMQSKKMMNWRMLGVVLETGDETYYLKFDAPVATATAAEAPFRASFGGNAKTEKAQEVKADEE